MRKAIGIFLAALATIGFTVGATGCGEKAQTAIENVGGMIAGAIEENGIGLKAVAASADEVAATAESAIEVTATVTPSTANYEGIFYSVYWKTAQAESVTNYVTVTQETDGSNTATVTCLKAFSTPIILTAQVMGAASLEAELQIDYVKRFSERVLWVDEGGFLPGENTSKGRINATLSDDILVGSRSSEGVGTISDSVIRSIKAYFNNEKLTALNAATGYAYASKPFSKTFTEDFSFKLMDLFTVDGQALTEASEEYTALSSWLAANASEYLFFVDWIETCEYNDDLSITLSFNVEATTLAVAPTNIMLSKSGIIF